MLLGACVGALAGLGCDGATPAPADATVDVVRDATTALDEAFDATPDAVRVWVPDPFTPTPATRSYCGSTNDDAVEARITAALAALTLEEKLAMMAGAAVVPLDRRWRVPGNDRLGLPGLGMLDGPRGVSAFLHVPSTVFPVAMMRGATWDPALETRVGAALAQEIRSVGADTVLAPTMNILRHPRWGRAQETYSEDTEHLGTMAAAFIRGVQSQGVLASAKHLAAYSIENTRHRVDVAVDERTLREVYLPQFRRAVQEANVASVMSAYNRVNGAWCDESAFLLNQVLRGEWGFAGFVESDWVLGTHGDVTSLRAGLDIEMPVPLHFRALGPAVRNGSLSEHEVDAALRHILRAQLCYGLDARPHVSDDPSLRNTPEHVALAREVAQRGMVLLKNDAVRGAPALPLGPSVHDVVVLGRNATRANLGDLGSSNVTPSTVVTAVDGLSMRAGVTVHAFDGTALDAAATTAVRAADAVVIVTGMDADDEGEAVVGAGDRASLALPAGERALIQAATALNPRVVVVLEGGAAILTHGWRDAVPAVVFAFYPGAQGGLALADVLFGDAAPSGRLPFSIPEQESDLPPFDDTSDHVTYGFLHGYRHLGSNGVAPAHAFGAGLSYTSFAYANPGVSQSAIHVGDLVDVRVDVTNTGTRRALETVQVYVHARASSVPRAPRDLRGFTQVDVAAGATVTAHVSLRVDDLRYWDASAHAWVLEPGTYDVIAAHDSVADGVRTTLQAQ